MQIKVNLDTVIFYVRDVEKLKAFYVNTFKLQPVEDYGSTWTLLEAGNFRIGLHKIGEQYQTGDNRSVKFHNNTKIVFEIDDDLNKVREYLVGQKVAMREIKTFEGYDYWLCDGEDPEGNVFQLKQKK